MKKMKFFMIASLALLMLGFVMIPEADAQTRPQDFRGRLAVWSFTDEVNKMINDYFRRAYRNVEFNYTQIPTEEFTTRLDAAFSAGTGLPDVIVLESAFVRKYIESGQLLDITDIYEANRNKLLAYPVEVGTHNGRVYGMSWQACPGAMFYRRSLAKKYLGTEEPAMVQSYFSNMTRFLETAKLIQEKSGGNSIIIPGFWELFRPFLGMRSSPWIVNGQLNIDPAMEQFMDVAKTMTDNGWTTGVSQWSPEWFAGMKGELKEWDGNSHLGTGKPYETFAYFLPSWGLHYVLKTNTPGTSGDWAMIAGPVPYQWGGTWLAIPRNSPNAALAKEFIRYLTTDDGFLERWARDTGDIVGNVVVQEKIRTNIRDRFLGNQNHYMLLSEVSRNINGKLIQANDELIDAAFSDAVNGYLWNGKSKTQALADFRAEVNAKLGLR